MNIKINDIDITLKKDSNKNIPNYDWFVSSLSSNNWEKDIFNVIDKNANEFSTALDIGAWIGPTAIYMSKKFGNVLAIEADKVAVEALHNNIKDNRISNIKIIEKVFFNDSHKEIYFGQNENRSEGFGDSMSQSRQLPLNDKDYKISTISFKDIVDLYKDEHISFVKVDIEGGEENILEDLFLYSKKYNWNVYLSFHLSWWKKPDLNRFQHLLDKVKTIHFGDIILDSNRFFDYIRNHQFGSFYLEF